MSPSGMTAPSLALNAHAASRAAIDRRIELPREMSDTYKHCGGRLELGSNRKQP